MTDLSIIFPCYNEGSNLKQIIDEIKTIKNDNFGINLEFILVNNGSTDNTSEILLEPLTDRHCRPPWHISDARLPARA